MIEILSELFRIVDGALRQDAPKVRNYALLVADKLEAGGDAPSAKRLRQLVEEKSGQLRPARLNQGSTPPVDQESRFPLVELVSTPTSGDPFVCDADQQAIVDEFVSLVEKRGVLERHGLETAPSLLLYGPPGCGKSLLAQHIAQRLGLPMYLARLDSLVSSFLGSTSKNLRAVFDYAARQPCILFLDEFDAVAKLRDDPHEMGELKRVVNSFLQAFDSHAKDLIVIAATNHDQLLDAAIWRRFQLTLNLRLPSEVQRLKLWTHHTTGFEWSEKVILALANLSEGLSGAQIVTICQRLKQRKLMELSQAEPSDAMKLLCGLWENSSKSTPPVTSRLLGERSAFATAMQKRDENLFNQTVIAELAGVSKSTLSREISPPKKKRGLLPPKASKKR
jgi:energy-coupling factor transporter ATP-binding protein EcfA2